MEKCLIDLYSACTQITSDHFSALGTRKDQTQYPQSIEQSFSAELYHRFKSIMELPVNIRYYEQLQLNFDITKAAVDSRPDLVLHHSQADRKGQAMFIEVKTDVSANLDSDFNKLILATHDYLNFRNVVLIVVNRKFDTTLKTISSYNDFHQIEFDRKERITIINIYEYPEKSGRIEYDMFNLRFLKQK